MTDPQNPQNPHDPAPGHPGQPGQQPQYGAQQPPGQPYGQTPPGGAQYGQAPYGAPPQPYPAQPYPPQPYPAPPARKKKKKKWPWILGALVVLLIIVLAATSGGGSDSTDTTADSGASTAPQNPAAPESPGPASAPAQIPTETQPPAGPDLSSEQKNAVSKAEDYLSLSGFSKSGLVKQLEFEGYSNADAVVAVDKLEADGDVNWNEQAAKKAGEYQAVTPMSRQGLVQQLEFEGFTSDQAAYGADNAES